jgi:hypothetical protein
MHVLNQKRTWFAVLGVTASLTVGATPGHALLVNGFQGDYAPSNWTFSTTGIGTGSSVNTAGAPDSIELTGPDGGQPDPSLGNAFGVAKFTTKARATGTVSFDWSVLIGVDEFSTFDDPFGFWVNADKFELTDDLFGDQSGSYSYQVTVGDIFGFYVETATSQFGPTTATISNFTAPVPGPLPILGVAAAFRASRKLRVLTRETAKRA